MRLEQFTGTKIPTMKTRYALGETTKADVLGTLRPYHADCASIFEIRWHQDGPEHFSEYATMVAYNVRLQEARALCFLLNGISDAKDGNWGLHIQDIANLVNKLRPAYALPNELMNSKPNLEGVP